jgi:D-alanyl-D-alanine carboxypeptidase
MYGILEKSHLRKVSGLALVALLLISCQPTARPANIALKPDERPASTSLDITELPVRVSPMPRGTRQPPAAPTMIPTTTPSPTPEATATATATFTPTPSPTATPIGPCDQRMPDDDLLAIVTLEYGLSRDFAPKDLVPLSDYLSPITTLGYPTEVRQILVEPLVQMIQDMQAAGLEPLIISGYRSYASQAIAWNKWLSKEPERASILSAPPGYSEHQLGTTLDFGSPELPDIVGQEEIQFHTYFYMTRVSMWLSENAHRYGFSLSYPREAFELTGFYYEPWHYRYVGVELATQLKETGKFLAQFQLEAQSIPCIP